MYPAFLAAAPPQLAIGLSMLVDTMDTEPPDTTPSRRVVMRGYSASEGVVIRHIAAGDVRHRTDGPARVSITPGWHQRISLSWYFDGEIGRLDGPSRTYGDGNIRWAGLSNMTAIVATSPSREITS